MITIKAKPFETKVKIPGYGIYYLRHLGAGDEADIRNMLEDANADITENADKYREVIETERRLTEKNNQKELAVYRGTPIYLEAKEAQKKAGEKLQKAIAYSVKCQLELWRSDEPEAMEKLFKDFTSEQIIGFYQQAMTEAKNG